MSFVPISRTAALGAFAVDGVPPFRSRCSRWPVWSAAAAQRRSLTAAPVLRADDARLETAMLTELEVRVIMQVSREHIAMHEASLKQRTPCRCRAPSVQLRYANNTSHTHAASMPINSARCGPERCPTSGGDDDGAPSVAEVGAHIARPLRAAGAAAGQPVVRPAQRLHDAVAVHDQLEALPRKSVLSMINVMESNQIRLSNTDSLSPPQQGLLRSSQMGNAS